MVHAERNLLDVPSLVAPSCLSAQADPPRTGGALTRDRRRAALIRRHGELKLKGSHRVFSPCHRHGLTPMSALAQLFDYLDGLHQRPAPSDLVGKLEQLDLARTLEE